MFLHNRIATLWLALVTVLAWSALATAQSNSLFSTIALNSTGTAPCQVVTGDFNGDGIMDMAVSVTGANAVDIYLGTGDGNGNFGAAVSYPVGGGPTAIVTGDFNHDGHLDLAVANTSGQSVSILLGQGDGTFKAGGSYSAGFGPLALGVGDFDGDGNLDLAVVDFGTSNSGYVAILRGKPDGSFQEWLPTYSIGEFAATIAVGDFNGDGKPDLAVGFAGTNGGASQVVILTNNGSGGFQSGAVLTALVSGGIASVTAADFNGDGKLDLAAVSAYGTSVTIFQGNGNGTFNSVSSSPTVGRGPQWVAAGDLNGDGKMDLVTANYLDGTVSVLLGNGDETFANAVSYPVGTQPFDLALADLNGDGKLDVSVVNSADNNVQVLLGGGDGTLRAGTYRVSAKGSSQIASGDFNGDGIPDLAVFNLDDTVTVLLGDGRGGFQRSSTFSGCGQPTNQTPGQIVEADFDGDGKTDLAIACNAPSASEVDLFRGNGDGSFQHLALIPIGNPYGVVTILASDWNGDGIAELIYVLDDDEFSCSVPAGACQGILHTGENVGLKAGDFNGDGKVDFLVVQENNGEQAVALGDGTGNFQFSFLQESANSALVGDFNGDGLSDIEFYSFPNGLQAQAFLSNGDGSFRNGFELSSNRLGVLQAVADFNGDGILDLLSVGPFGIFFGKDDGTFADSGIPSIPFGVRSAAAIADFDGNGSPDVAIVDPNTGLLSVLINKNSFQPTSTSLSWPSAKAVAGGPVALSASVSSKQGTPTGSITFKQSGVPETTTPLTGGTAQATLTAPTISGTCGFTALYTGDGTFGGSLSQRLLVTVSAASTTTTVTSSASPSKSGQSVTFTATVHPQYSGAPTGTVQFYADGSPIGMASITGGQAAFSTNALPMGSHTIQADYSGDSSFITSLGSVNQKVGDAASTVVFTSSLNPAVYGQPVTLTATVTDSARQTPSGFVVFTEGSTVYGTASLSGGVAQVVLPAINAGKHTITAQYSGDASDNSSKATLVQIIDGVSSSTTVTVDTEPSTYGQTVTFTAVVSSISGTPGGTVTFKNGSVVLGTAAISAGQATYAISTLSGGAHTITAVYNGSGEYASSTGSVQQVVVPAATTTTLTSSANPAPNGQNVTFTAVVASAAAAAPTGKVTFKDGKTVLGTASLVNGQAQLSTSLLATGSHAIMATYASSANFSGSSGSLSQVIQ